MMGKRWGGEERVVRKWDHRASGDLFCVWLQGIFRFGALGRENGWWLSFQARWLLLMVDELRSGREGGL